MSAEEDVLEAVQYLERDTFERLCLTCFEKLGIQITNFKAMDDKLIAEGTVERNGGTTDYIIKFSRAIEEDPLDELKRSLSPSTEGLFLTPLNLENSKADHERIEIVGGKKLYRLLKKFDLISRFDLVKDESPSKVLKEKGEFFLKQGKHDRAIDLLERAVDIDKDLSDAWKLLGKAYERFGEEEKALEAYESASESKPMDIEIAKEKGRLLYELDRYDEAILCFESILENSSGSKEVWNNKALCHLRNGEYEESIDSIEKALSIDPTFENALLNKVLIFEGMGEIKKALDAVEDLIEKVPEKAKYHYAKSAYLVALKRFEDGKKALDEALKLNPEHEGSKRLRSRLEDKL